MTGVQTCALPIYIGKDSGLLIVAAVFGFVGVVMLIASIGFTVLGMLGYM